MSSDLSANLIQAGFVWNQTLYFRDDPLWRPKDADHVTYIGELDPMHRVFLWRFLMRRAWSIQNTISFNWLCGPLAPRGDMAMLDVEQMTDEMADDPRGWLRSTPFVMALEALIIGDGNASILEDRPAQPNDQALSFDI